MALAEVHAPGGQLLASFRRRDEDRAWRTVQTQATTEHSLEEEGATESRRRWPTGTRVTMDGQPWATLTPAGWSRSGVAAAPPAPVPDPSEVSSDY